MGSMHWDTYMNMCTYIYVTYLLTCTASTLLTDVVPSGVTEEDTLQDVHTSYPHTIHSGIDLFIVFL